MKAANSAKNSSYIQIRSTYTHIRIDMEKLVFNWHKVHPNKY